MSDSRDQSYYEIALTNRQVMGVFVVLLVCVLASFLGGVWVGRSDAPFVATVEPEAITSGVAAGEKPLEQLDFFSSGERVEPAIGDAVPPRQGVGEAGGEPDSAGASQPVIIEELARTPPPRAAEEVRVPAETEGTRQRGAGAVSEISALEVEAGATVSDEVVVQVFSSNDEDQAQRVLGRVRSGGYPAVLSPIDVDGKAMYRVRVGPYTDRAEAQTVADRIRRTYKLDTWITR